ncbi:MAG TPA: hypothetical protein VK202_05035 [Bacteroidia bacterium]|nr:hypothetical protein [Bacteroidia bacterium]
MTKLIYIFGTLCWLLSFSSVAQQLPSAYAIGGGQYEQGDSSKGYYLPAFDTIRSLIIFADYGQYTHYNPRWPQGSKEVPEFCQKLLTPPAQAIDSHSLTAYFKEASLGKLFLGGDFFPEVIRADSSLTYYHSHGQMGGVANDVLQQVIKSGRVNWSLYDNWGKTPQGNWRKQPDGSIDNIIIVFRDDPQQIDARWAWLGTGGGIAALMCPDIKINGQLRISGGSMGSGLLVNGGADYFPRFFKLLKHELAHFFTRDHYAGLNGFYGPDFTNHGAWGLAAAHGSSSVCVNAWDRNLLGWSKYRYDADALTAKDTLLELHDFVTTGDAARIKLPYAAEEYFLLEYHNNTGIFDNVDLTTDGLYILHQTGDPENHLDCEEADGRWDFVRSDSIESFEPCCGKQPMIKRLEANPLLGFGDRDEARVLKTTDEKLTWNSMQRALVFAVEGEQHLIHCDGDGGDAFTPEYGRNEFSLSTNPSSASNGIHTATLTTHLNGIQVKVLKMEKNKITVQLRYRYFNVDNDTRFTGKVVLHDSLIVNERRTLLLNQSQTFNQLNHALPATSLELVEGGSITLQKKATLIVDESSTIILRGNGKIYLGENARLVFKNGAKLLGDERNIIKAKGAKVVYRN